MTDALLVYLCGAMTFLCWGMRRMTRYADNEQASAIGYREYVKPLFTDLLEAKLLELAPDMERALSRRLAEKPDDVLAGAQRENGDGEKCEPDFHVLSVAHRSDS